MKMSKWFAGLIACAAQCAIAANPAQAPLDADAAQLRVSRLAKAGPTDAEVGDADSFGRNVRWDGVLQSGFVSLLDDCTLSPPDPALPDDRCVTLNPAPAVTSFDFPDIGRMTLPGRSFNSLMCHWLSPIVNYSFENNTGVPQPNAQFRLVPYIDVYSAVLADPALVDPTTGLPFGGKLQTGFAAAYGETKSLAPGERASHRFSESRTCIAGFLTRRALVELYGLSEAQAREFFRKEITLQFGLRGSASMVGNGTVAYGLRVVGD